MGGGAAMRAAAKAATVGGIGLSNGGSTLRSGIPENLNAARKVIRHSTSSIHSSTSSAEASAASQTYPASAWELDDWELNGYGVEEELPPPRRVFGPAPSLQETTEATTELRDALDVMYFSPPNSAGCYGSPPSVDKHHELTSVPKEAYKAFKLLRESPAVQNVVMSIAADPVVWDAVQKNEALKEFWRSQEKSISSEEPEPLESSKDSLDNQDAGNSENVFTNVFENIKLSVAGWVDNLTGFFQEWFGGSDDKTTAGPDNSSNSSAFVGKSLIGLAIMVMMVVVMKRG